MGVKLRTANKQTYILFWCPGCKEPHAVSVNGPDGWHWNGSVEYPTFRPSVLAEYHNGNRCHSYVTDGVITFLSDCTHDLKGQIVDLPDFPKNIHVHGADDGFEEVLDE